MKNLKSKKKKIVLLLTSFTTMLAVTLVALFSTRDYSSTSLIASNEYSVTLSSSNGGGGFPSSYGSGVNENIHTTKGNKISFTYNNVKSTSNKFCTVASGGYLYNSTEITGLESVNVTFGGGSLSLYSSKSTTFSGDATSLSSGSTISISPNFNYFKLVASGETAINSITILYTCATRPEISEVTDVITADDLEATTTSYLDFSGVTKSTGAVYAGNSAKDSSGNIQLRTNKSSAGIVTTTSGGTVSSVKINVASGSNSIDVYGSSDAYTSATELYNSSSQGTKVGSVTSTGTINFTGDNANFTHVGIRSGSGAVYISSIEIKWLSSGGSGGSGGGESGGGESGGGSEQQTEASATITYLNSGLTSSNYEPSSYTEPTQSWTLSDDSTVVSGSWTGNSYNNSYYEEIIMMAGAKLSSTSDVVVKTITVDWYGDHENHTVYSGSSSVDGEDATSKHSGTAKVYEINSATWSIENNTTKYKASIYEIIITCEINVGPIEVSGVTLSPSVLNISEEEKSTLTATVSPSNATNKNLTWSTSDESVATVSNTGLVTGVGAGTAIITVTTEDGGFTATCTVTVTAVYHVTGVSLNKSGISLHPGDQDTLTATVSPSNASNKNVTWSTNNSSVATVSGGTVTAVGAGTATITVTTEDKGLTASCTVTVTNVAVSGVSLNKSSLTLTRLGSETLTASVAPSNATNKTINWSSSNTSVATVSSSGLVTAVGAGSAVIYAKSAENSAIQATCNVTVNPINVSNVSLNKNALSLGIGASETLTVTVTPSNADNTNINWSTSDSSVASVSNGQVTGVGEGTATITAASAADSSKKATCTVTVTRVTDCTIDFSAQGFSNEQQVTSVSKESFTVTFAQGSGNNAPKYYTSGTGVRTYANNTFTVATSGSDKISKIVFDCTQTDANPTASTGTFTSSSGVWTGSATSITFTNGSSGQYRIKTVTITVTPSAPVAATGVNLPASQEVGIGSSASLPLTYSPSNANTNLGVIWSKVSGSTKITVDNNGKVSVDENATTSDTAKIRVTLTSKGAYAECNISCVEVQKAKYTVLLYLCGSTLEYDSEYNSLDGAATTDMTEILNAEGTYSDDVNFVVETGGSQKWKTTYGVSKDKLEVRHVSGGSFVKDNVSTINSQANMGEAATLQTFLEYGLTAYPADKTALILWDHGGAMTGVCCDDNYDMECLTTAEVKSAVSGALSNCNMAGQKLEWIGYDACLMGVADIASINSDYFNYMVAAQESEPGGGWDYETWVSTLYNNPTDTPTILSSITSSYKASYNGNSKTNWATLAAYDLAYMPAFTTAFENFAGQLVDSNWSKLATAHDNSLRFGANDSGEYFYGIADMKSFMNKVASQISSLSSYTTAVNTALNNLIISNEYCSYYNNKSDKPCGICVFMGGYTDNTQYYSYTMTTDYTTDDTKFSTWRQYTIKNGEWYQ